MFNEDQKQHVLEVVQLCADGMYTTEEMVRKLEAICKEANPEARFMTYAEAFGTADDPVAAVQAEAVMNSESVMARRP